ncbi:hypothetical protein RHSIM_Rhsim04G0093000 [Rhododendron simsii]|uniref:Uncharacterized protein n=1 Tax=Rhododendron simsii TaxID=118357 RepID=A0A834LRY4_RHOSS|nr:hypothetical protein RHSIM_Rhsim04G0093000 [Rhododendron simsii]
MDEIAAGLHSNGVKYLLVARDKASSVKESVCGGLGMVVPCKLVAEDWKIGWKAKGATGDLVRGEEIVDLVRRFMDSKNVGRKEQEKSERLVDKLLEKEDHLRRTSKLS